MVGGGAPDRGKCTIEVVVDGAAEVEIRGDQGVLRNLSGNPPQWRRFECTGLLPSNPAEFRFAGVDGRGRQDLVRAARLNGPPNSDSIGRGMKVNKEEMLGMLVAIELYLKRDHAADWKEWERRVKIIADSVSNVPTLTTDVEIPPIANHVPHLNIRWDQNRVKLSPLEVMKQLRDGDPSIEANPGTDKNELMIGVWMLQPGEAEIVARRLRAVLKSA